MLIVRTRFGSEPALPPSYHHRCCGELLQTLESPAKRNVHGSICRLSHELAEDSLDTHSEENGLCKRQKERSNREIAPSLCAPTVQPALHPSYRHHCCGELLPTSEPPAKKEHMDASIFRLSLRWLKFFGDALVRARPCRGQTAARSGNRTFAKLAGTGFVTFFGMIRGSFEDACHVDINLLCDPTTSNNVTL